MTRQLDAFRDQGPALARAYRAAAETAINNPFEAPDKARQRAEHYLAEAQRIEKDIRHA
jgi:hypothetical protein